MMTKGMSGTVAVAVVVLGLWAGGASAVVESGDASAVDAVREAFNTAFNAGDAQAMDSIIGRDAIWMPPGQAAVAGHDQVVGLYAAAFAGPRSKIELKPGDIQLCGDCAYLSGDFDREDPAEEEGAAKKITGHYLFVLERDSSGAWKIVRDIWNETLSP